MVCLQTHVVSDHLPIVAQRSVQRNLNLEPTLAGNPKGSARIENAQGPRRRCGGRRLPGMADRRGQPAAVNQTGLSDVSVRFNPVPSMRSTAAALPRMMCAFHFS